MHSTKITSIEILKEYLRVAMQIEHATIPPYLLALYSIRPGVNVDATQLIRVVVVEEMLHLSLAANILNAVGGSPDLTAPDFVPTYPTYLPNGENDFKVDLQAFSQDAIETFLNIERPGKAPTEDQRLMKRIRHLGSSLVTSPDDVTLHYYSIGEFYEEIIRGLQHLNEHCPDELFTGDPARQVTSECFYSGGGKLFPVTCIDSAVAATQAIISQGEGFGGGIYDNDHELAHLYRFEQIKFGRYYQKGDTAGYPTGPNLTVDWNAVYPLKKNARLADYEDTAELYAAAVSFNQSYADFLGMLTEAYNGQPKLLLDKAVPGMFVLRNKMLQLIHYPLPNGEGLNAAPTFEMAGVSVAVTA